MQTEENPNRWLALFLSCLLLFGNYYAYDNPAALSIPLREYLQRPVDVYQYELNLLYSVYSVPNMILPLIGGQLLDRYNQKSVVILFSSLVLLGQVIFSIGVQVKSFPAMLTGRILFGIGGESVSVIQSAITTALFRGKEVAFALGMSMGLEFMQIYAFRGLEVCSTPF